MSSDMPVGFERSDDERLALVRLIEALRAQREEGKDDE